MSDARSPSDADRLIDFLRDHDAPCPLCRYNLRALTKPECPECRHALALTVGIPRLRFEWLIAAVTPCTFSGIAAILLLIPIIAQPVSGNGPPPPGICLLDAFGWASGITGAGLFARRYAFLRMQPGAQRLVAIVIWGVHLTAFLMMVLVAISFA
jgi:hypothetical protein